MADVAAAIRAAGVTVPDGRLFSVIGGVLNAHAHPATILVDGHLASVSTPVRAGDVVTFIPGADTVESMRTVRQPVYLPRGAATLYLNYQPGLASVVQGTISGQQAGYSIVRAPAVGRLRAAARLALTFDDGPNGSYTAAVLQTLTAHHTPAVFCLIGQHVLADRVLVRAELAAGEQVCDHTQNHPLNLPTLPPSRITAEIHDGEQSILGADGNVAPVYFRAPGGNWSATIIDDARADNLIPLGWTVDPTDWAEPGTATILTRVLDQLRPDGVVLFHDGGGDRSQTVAALSQLLAALTASGWVFSFPTWIK